MTDSSQRRHAIIVETVPGTTPSSPVFQTLRLTGGGMSEKSQYVSSEQISAHRNVIDSSLVAVDVDGEFPFEFSYGSFDTLISLFLCSTWLTDEIVNGVDQKTFTYELTDEMGATDDYERYTGCVVNSMALDIQARSKVTGSFGVMGKAMTVASAIISGATYTAAEDTPIITSSANVGSITVNGSSVGDIRTIRLEGTNNNEVRPVVGDVSSKGFRKGQFNFSGTMETYFNSKTLRDLQRTNALTDIVLNIGGASEEKYIVTLPNVRLTLAEKNRPGNNEDVMLNVAFQALYDETTAGSIHIERIPAS